MDRLTKRLEDGQAVMNCLECDLNRDGCCTALACRNRLKDRLADYEDTGLRPDEMNAVKLLAASADHEKARRLIELSKADANGLVVVLPCKVGDMVYRLEVGCCKHREKDTCTAYCEGYEYSCPDYESDRHIVIGHFCLSDITSIGKTVFLTREEAEMALKELRK